MKDIKACLTSNSDDWATPNELYRAFMDDKFIDVCPFKSEIDMFGSIYDHEYIYMNPPFSQLKRWCDYALELVEHDCVVFLLMPVRTDTKYFSKVYKSGVLKKIWFFNHRLHFNEGKSAPFPSMMLYLSACNRGEPIIIDCISQEDFIREVL